MDSRLALKIVTASEMRQIDRMTSERLGVPSLTLMENAGSAVAEFVMSDYPSIRQVGVICGKGNNGGDGLVAARKLHDAGREVRVLLLAEPSELQGDAREMLRRLPVSPAQARSNQELDQPGARAVFDSELLIDAILGTGFKPPASGLYAAAIARLNAELSPGGGGGHSFGRGCRCHGRAGRNDGARRCHPDLHRAASGTYFWMPHRRVPRWSYRSVRRKRPSFPRSSSM